MCCYLIVHFQGQRVKSEGTRTNRTRNLMWWKTFVLVQKEVEIKKKNTKIQCNQTELIALNIKYVVTYVISGPYFQIGIAVLVWNAILQGISQRLFIVLHN